MGGKLKKILDILLSAVFIIVIIGVVRLRYKDILNFFNVELLLAELRGYLFIAVILGICVFVAWLYKKFKS